MNKKRVSQIFEILRKNNPNPTTELVYSTPFQLLISVILSAQATDISVNKATQQLYEIAPSPEAIINLGESGLKFYIKTIGLYNTKAKNIIKTCQILIEKHNSDTPTSREDLEALPGVGRKTANVILNTAFGQPTIAVDTHVFRVANRTGIALGKNVQDVEKKLLQVIPKEFIKDAHHWLILHGRYVCTARAPKCEGCRIRQYCRYHNNTSSLSSHPSQ